jgi:hypothetical protein
MAFDTVTRAAPIAAALVKSQLLVLALTLSSCGGGGGSSGGGGCPNDPMACPPQLQPGPPVISLAPPARSNAQATLHVHVYRDPRNSACHV